MHLGPILINAMHAPAHKGASRKKKRSTPSMRPHRAYARVGIERSVAGVGVLKGDALLIREVYRFHRTIELEVLPNVEPEASRGCRPARQPHLTPALEAP